MGFKKKRVEKTSPSNKVYKNPPPPPGGRKLTLDRFAANLGKHSVCRLRWFQLSAHFALVGRFREAARRPNILKGFWNSQGVAKKQGKNQGFFGCLMCVFFSISSPHGHLSSWHTSLFANVSFILAFLLCCYVFLLCGGCVSLFLFIFIFAVLFTCHSVVCLCLSSLLVWQKPRSNHKISEILIFIFCFGACIPTLSLGPDHNPTRAREEPLKMFFFCCLASWSISNVTQKWAFQLSVKFFLFFGWVSKISLFLTTWPRKRAP